MSYGIDEKVFIMVHKTTVGWAGGLPKMVSRSHSHFISADIMAPRRFTILRFLLYAVLVTISRRCTKGEDARHHDTMVASTWDNWQRSAAICFHVFLMGPWSFPVLF
jgi:hypothetical protein